MYLRKIEPTDTEFIIKNYPFTDNLYLYEKTDISKNGLYSLIVKNKLYKDSDYIKYADKFQDIPTGEVMEYKNSYYYKLLKFCQSLPMKQYGNIQPYFDKYGVRKLKEMYKLSLKINKNEN